MILIIWTDGGEPSKNSELPRITDARIVRMDDNLEVMETIYIDCMATEAADADTILNDWKKLLETVLEIPNEDEKLYYFFPRAIQKNKFKYINTILHERYNIAMTNETHVANVGDLLVEFGERPGIDIGILRLIEIIQKQGINTLTENGYIQEVLRQGKSSGQPESTRRLGIFRCSSYHYFGDLATKKYHIRTCERLTEVPDEKLIGLGKNPEKNGWKSCPFCIHDINSTSSKPSATANSKPVKTAKKDAAKSVPSMEWEKQTGNKKPARTKAQTMQHEITNMCCEYGMHAEFIGGTAFITTVAGEWFFTYNDRPIRLHHKNYADSSVKSVKQTKLYHLQYEKFASPLHVLRYIGEHDLDLKRRVMQNMDGEIASDRYIDGEAELDMLGKAMIFAAKTHKSKAADMIFVPGVLHSAETALIASSMTGDTDVIIAAALHDVIDEGKAKTSDIKLEFGVRSLKYIESVSDKSRSDLKEFKIFKERKSRLIDYLFSKASVEERIIILSDALSTMRFFNRDLQQHGIILWEKYSNQDKGILEWYCKGLRDALGKMQDIEAWKEFKIIIDKVFDDNVSEDINNTVVEHKAKKSFAVFLRRLFRSHIP